MTIRATRLLRLSASVAALALLAACASQGPRPSATQEAARYAARARGNYLPPGPPQDPWGPYIREASARFDVPELWIRSVMRVESGGKEYRNGQLITSWAGAMGLMQVMPQTYDELRQRHNLGDDPYDPHENILAGTAYMREMYDIYGSPGFLAAYNAGPNRLDDYLSNNRPLPDETRRYVAMIGPNIVGVYPNHHSAAENYAMNELPINIPPGPRYGRAVQLASREGGGGRVPARGFHLISPANAEPVPMRRTGVSTGQWAIQVGAYANEGQAKVAVGEAQAHAHVELAVAHGAVASVHVGHGVLWRARLTGLSREGAVDACAKLSHSGHLSCMVLSPEAQS